MDVLSFICIQSFFIVIWILLYSEFYLHSRFYRSQGMINTKESPGSHTWSFEHQRGGDAKEKTYTEKDKDQGIKTKDKDKDINNRWSISRRHAKGRMKLGVVWEGVIWKAKIQYYLRIPVTQVTCFSSVLINNFVSSLLIFHSLPLRIGLK